jgi:hypothetical protein
MNLEAYPQLWSALDDESLSLRHLLNVDTNEEDFDSEEYEFDCHEYNYVVYLSELIQDILKEEKMEQLRQRLSEESAFENFLVSEEDLFGVKSSLSEEEMARVILGHIEALV